jgi:eukaryotic-like serine/threonine-protein kinase
LKVDLNLNQAWQLLSLSRIFGEEQLARIRARFEQEQGNATEPTELWGWLVKSGSLTPYQANLFSSGLNGPFRLENYLLLDRVNEGPLKGNFLAKHSASQHPVQLVFFASGSPDAQQVWQAWCERAGKLAGVAHPALTRTFEAVTLPDHAFVVTAVPPGTSLDQKVPRKTRLPWQQATAIGAQIASALSSLEKIGLAHGSVSPRSIWLVGKSQVQLLPNWNRDEAFATVQSDSDEASTDYTAPELLNSDRATVQGDLYSLGCVLYRLISGRPVTQGTTLAEKRQSVLQGIQKDLSKYDVPVALQQLLDKLLAKSSAERPQTALEVARMLADISSQPLEQLLPRSETPASLAVLLKAISEQTPVVTATKFGEPQAQVAVAPIEELPAPKPATPVPTLTLAELREIRQAKRRRIWLATASSVFLFAAFLGLLGWSLNRGPLVKSPLQSTTGQPVSGMDQGADSTKKEDGELAAADPNAVIKQKLVTDDGRSLWQSPTSGQPANLAYLPPGAKIVLIVRPAELLSDIQGQLLYGALDNDLQTTINQWSEAFATPLVDIQSMVVGLYPTESQQYVALARITFAKPVPRSELGQRWGVDLLAEDSDSNLIARGNEAIYLLPRSGFGVSGGSSAQVNGGMVVETFLYGPTELVTLARDSANADNLSGPFFALNKAIDSRRHVNLLFQPSALFNDEGEWLMSGTWAPVNRYLRTVLDESARAGLFSLHLDNGVYLELSLSHSVDKLPAELKRRLDKQFREARLGILEALTTTSANPYWERVRLRFDNMLNDLARNLRTGIERQLVVANCWLPPMAAHNLLAGAELALSLGDATVVPDAIAPTKKSSPQTLEELLAMPRSLSVTTNPDLNQLLLAISTEVNEQFPEMPFKLRIELAGTDLAKEGITQNQRPGDFTADQKPLSAILTEIMLRANPDKSAKAASDPNCKLVWVIAVAPNNPAERIIQVTTRSAASERGLPLPAQFAPPVEK